MPTEGIKETFKKLTQQQNHEIDFCKKDLQNTLRRKGKAFYPCQWKIRGQLYVPIQASFVMFFALFEINFLLW